MPPGKIEMFIGWDPGQQTFYFQGYDWNQPEQDNPVLWLGALPPYYPDLDGLLAELKPFELPADIRRELLEDQRLNRTDHG
jgi:hypothetical protein